VAYIIRPLTESITSIALRSKTLHRLIKPRAPSIYDGSPFEALHGIPSPRGKGKHFHLLAKEIMTEKFGPEVFSRHNTIFKGSTCWQGQLNKFCWEQLRSFEVFDRAVFVGINPSSVRIWFVTRNDLDHHVFGNDSRRQHGPGVYWITPTHSDYIPHFFRDIETWND
jgi:hypothetical protein